MKKLSVLFLLFSSCVVVVENGEVKKGKGALKEEKVLPSSQSVTLSSPSANLSIYGWEKDSVELKYEILKGKGDVKVKREKGETEINVVKEEDEDFEIEITLIVPYRTDLRVETGAGKITLENLEGNMKIQLGTGSIEAKETGGKVKAEIGTGKLTGLFEETVPYELDVNIGIGEAEIIINPDSEIEFNARCGIGRIETDFEFDKVREKSFFIGESLEGVKGDGKKDFNIEVGIGKVSLYASE